MIYKVAQAQSQQKTPEENAGGVLGSVGGGVGGRGVCGAFWRRRSL